MAAHAPLAVVKALEHVVRAATRSDGGSLFDRVEVWPQVDLVDALKNLRIYENRFCLIVPTGAEMENVLEGRNLKTAPNYQVTLLFTDRAIGNRQHALAGSGSVTGLLTLMYELMVLLSGADLGLRHTLVRIESSEPFAIQGADRANLPGREGWQIDLSIHAGVIVTSTTLHR